MSIQLRPVQSLSTSRSFQKVQGVTRRQPVLEGTAVTLDPRGGLEFYKLININNSTS